MRKTSVYLPDAVKAALAGAAERSGRSEAELIRVAVERLVRTSAAGTDDGRDRAVRRPLPSGPRLVGVGVGPGDPDLLTDRARRLLRNSDRVFAATTSVDAVGRAEAVVRAAEPDVGVERLVLHIAPGRRERLASVHAAGERIASCLDAGELVTLALLGDPNLFSPFASLTRVLHRLRPGAAVDTVPGIMAFQELAARTGTVVAEDGQRAALVTLGDPDPGVGALLEQDDTAVVVCKGGRGLPALAATLDGIGRLDSAVVGELLGLPGERTVPLRRVSDRPGAYLATTIIPARRGATVISFVGAGPGAADLVTLRGAARLAAADVVVWAASLVPPELLAHCRPDVEVHDSATMTLDDVTGVYAAHPGAAIVRLHSGDPTIYSAVGEQIDWCRAHGRAYEIVPGVSAVTATAAAAGRELTVPGRSQTVVLTRLAHRTARSVPDGESVAELARRGATMALYLSAGRPEALRAELLCDGSAYTPATPVVLGYRVTWPDEEIRVSTVGRLVDDLAALGHRTSVLILVGDSLTDAEVPRPSHVYAAGFGHSHRPARDGGR